MPLTLERIGLTRRGRMPLQDLNLEVDDGSWLAVVGANGSGRSTLAEVATGLRKPQTGRVLLDGEDIWSREGKVLRDRLGLVMQRAEDQFLGMTVYDDVAFGPRDRCTDEAEIHAAVTEALRMVGFELDDVAGRSPLQLSGGQRRRVAVAAILAIRPDVLILDEPFAGLDAEARQDMARLLNALTGSGERTVITLTSDLQEVQGAGRIAVLAEGRIVLTGSLADMVANRRVCREAGVTLPDRIRIALELRERGWNVPVIGAEGKLEEAIAGEWRRRKHA
ncbi:MAG TPA: ATP-binding cassette domain-containing protein [Chloroflexota bacterium]|nr:ATP-binding cassette domain-containing protein [Chloroflexota bacterium]